MTGVIATPRFELRLLDAGDAALYSSLYGDPATMREIGPALDADRLARSFAATCRANAARPPRRRTWVIRERATERDLGLIGLVWDGTVDDAGRTGAELGVVLPPACQGRGVASEAIEALCGPAFATLGLGFLHTWHADGHALAAGLMRRVGFSPKAAGSSERGVHWRRENDRRRVG